MKIGIGPGLTRGGGRPSLGPEFTVGPTITAPADNVGETATCAVTATGTGTVTYAYKWRLDGEVISGTSSTRVMDAPGTYRCDVTATDDEGSRTKASNTILCLTVEALWLWNDGQPVALNDNTPLETEA